jgi:hypothetical protein
MWFPGGVADSSSGEFESGGFVLLLKLQAGSLDLWTAYDQAGSD